jgi:prepilin-type N-terminal cleavage/methylation domain-containing protein
MNIKQMKSMISKFRSADLSVVKDADMRAKAEKLQAKQAGFTLLELLVVVAILAIIAGAVISSLDGQEELAAQKTTVHTMAALEEGFKIYEASKSRTLPSNMDSLICTSEIDASAAAAAVQAGTDPQDHSSTAVVTAANSVKLGGLSNVARVGGGLTLDLGGKITVLDVPGAFAAPLTEAGLTSLRYAELAACNTAEGDASFGDDTALVDHVKPNLIFSTALVDDGEWEYGAGEEISFENYAATYDNGSGTVVDIPLAILEEATEITGNIASNDVVAVFGLGPNSDLIGNIVARAPADGNAGPDKYSHYSVAVKIAECPNLGVDIGATNCEASDWVLPEDGVEVVAILDAGGDAYDDEVAEARGNEEE